tara:strand:- start:15 stop:734 length:720 start_codon:yes stop_codon:yes gene_type:complete
MTLLILGLVIFLGVHSVSIFADRWRNRMIDSLGEGPFKGLYSLIALLGLILIIWGYGQARLTPELLYSPPVWLRHVSLVLLLPVFPLLFAAYLPGHIRQTLKHPMLVAVKLWALAHLLANGMLADVLLFGGFLAWAVADRISLKRRQPRKTPALPGTPLNDAIAVVSGLIVYGLFVVWLHMALIGVPPIQYTSDSVKLSQTDELLEAALWGKGLDALVNNAGLPPAPQPNEYPSTATTG